MRAVGEMTQQEKNMYAAVVLAESAAKLAQSAASYGEEVSEGLSQQWAGSYPHKKSLVCVDGKKPNSCNHI